MEGAGNHDTHDAHLGPSARRRAEPAPPDRDAVTLDVELRTGPRTRAWDELWARLLDGLRASNEADRDPGNDEESADTSTAADVPDS